MKAWPPRLSRPGVAVSLALMLTGAASALSMFSGPAGCEESLPRGRISRRHTDIEGFSPDGSILVLQYRRNSGPEELILRHAESGRSRRSSLARATTDKSSNSNLRCRFLSRLLARWTSSCRRDNPGRRRQDPGQGHMGGEGESATRARAVADSSRIRDAFSSRPASDSRSGTSPRASG